MLDPFIFICSHLSSSYLHIDSIVKNNVWFRPSVCVCVLISVKCECVELPFILQICKTRKKSAKNACVAINRKLLQQKEKLKKGKQKLQKLQEKVHDSMNGDKNYKKKTETQNKWQLHKRNRNEEK